ncbi:MAG TPA: trehalose-6-phosphate synthase [Candidatus Eisenbacteria bacterium]|nr:trehalose-6-phosphate synthase [Candidatus Eisenbacteria bacterium]
MSRKPAGGHRRQRLIVVSNRAPVEVERTDAGLDTRRTVGGLATALDDVLRDRGGLWIAWAGADAPDVLRPATTGLGYPIRSARLRPEDVDNFYGGFANQVLWPLCHIFPERCRFEEAFWPAYRDANGLFANLVAAEASPGDLVWVNDFHLSLVPAALRALDLGVRIGMFWHIPFPPPAVFGVCPWRAELLAGLLGGDLVAFQTEADVRNFLACVRDFLGLVVDEHLPRVRFGGRDVLVGDLPVGVDVARFRREAASAPAMAEAQTLRATLGTERVLLAVDRLDYTKGIIERLLGFERFLESSREWQGRVSLVQITAPSRFRIPQYRAMKQTIDETVGRITGRFTAHGRSPLVYLYNAFDHEHLAAYYRAADVALVTPLRDGMNLVAKEYVASQAGGDGVLVLSEFAGAACELREAVLVNPYEPDGIARQIRAALELPADERRERMAALLQRVTTRDVHWWTTAFLMLLSGHPDGPHAPTPVTP